MISIRTCQAVFAAALSVAGPVSAQSPLYEKVLLPVVVEGPLSGAFGSSWVTEIRILNRGPEAVAVFGILPNCFFECADPAILNPGVTFRPRVSFGEQGLNGVFVHPAAGYADDLSFGLPFETSADRARRGEPSCPRYTSGVSEATRSPSSTSP